MPTPGSDAQPFRDAAVILRRGRDRFLRAMADEVIDGGDDLVDNPYLFHEFLETQGTRLHFLSLVLAQFEQSAEASESEEDAPRLAPVATPKPAESTPGPRKARAKRIATKAATDGRTDTR